MWSGPRSRLGELKIRRIIGLKDTTGGEFRVYRASIGLLCPRLGVGKYRVEVSGPRF